MIQEGMGGYSRESGFDRLTVRNLERPNISLRDTRFDRLAPQEAGLAQIFRRDAVMGNKTVNEIAKTEVRDAGLSCS